MKKVIPYVNFGGRCEAALAFYAEALDGRVTAMMRHEDGPQPELLVAEHRRLVMHAEFEAGDVVLMATDGMPGRQPPPSETITLNVMLDDAKEQDRIFARLADGGEVRQPLHDAFWGMRFGMLVDRFGVAWMLNCTKGP